MSRLPMARSLRPHGDPLACSVPMGHVAIAAPSAAATDAAEHTVRRGGGAVDAAIAAAIVGMITEVGVAAPGAGAFLTVGGPDSDPVVFDGYMSVPGLDGEPSHLHEILAEMEYGGGVATMVGPASIAVPGAWAAFADAHERFGRVGFDTILAPARHAAHAGFTLGQSCLLYLHHSAGPVFSHDPASYAALHPDGRLVDAETPVRIKGLMDTLDQLAEHGPRWFLHGDLGRHIAEDLRSRGSRISVTDFRSYETAIREPLTISVGNWELSTNPPPAVGGAGLVALLAGLEAGGGIAGHLDAQERLFAWRRGRLHHSVDRASEIEAFLDDLPGDPITSPSTVHVSAVDDSGVACALTLSAGYGSGVIPTGTGLYMNNGLGELELVGDRDRLVPGERLNSNMAPTIARSDGGAVLAIGSPGADRITSALATTIAAFAIEGRSLGEAVVAPRFHVAVSEDGSVRVKAEPGALDSGYGRPVDMFEAPHMYFGGVGAAVLAASGELAVVSDPRRAGSARIVGDRED